LILMAPIIPHLSEELWNELGHDESIFSAGWPVVDESALEVESIEIPVQVNGKLRDKIMVPVGIDNNLLEKAALESEKIKTATGGGEIIKVIVIPGRLVNIVFKAEGG